MVEQQKQMLLGHHPSLMINGQETNLMEFEDKKGWERIFEGIKDKPKLLLCR